MGAYGVNSRVMFKSPPPPQEDGIYRAVKGRLRLPLAQRSNFWPPTAKLYEPLWRNRSLSLLTRGAFSTTRELALMLEWTRPQPAQLWLDAACSTGLYSRTLLAHANDLDVHALDISLPMLRVAQREGQKAGLAFVLVHGDVNALPYEDGVFDGVVCGGSLNEFLDVPRAVGEFSRVLKPGGRLWLMYLSKAETWPGQGGQRLLGLSGIRFIGPKTLEGQAARAKLKLQSAQYRERVAMALFRKAA